MKEYEYIRFKKIKENPKTSIFACVNKNRLDVLGSVKWHGPWRQYCFFPESETIFSVGCLNDINDFISILMKERKQ